MEVLQYTGLTSEQIQRYGELEKALGEKVYPLAAAVAAQALSCSTAKKSCNLS